MPRGRGALAVAAGGLVALIALTVPGPYSLAMVGYNTNPPTLALMALAITQVGVVLAVQPAANRWLRRTRPWTVVVASNAIILTVFCTVFLAVLVALFARIELRRPVLRPLEPGPLRDGATVVGMAAVVGGLLAVAVSGPDYHGPTGLPWGAVISCLAGAAVLRVARTQPVRSGAHQASGPPDSVPARK